MSKLITPSRTIIDPADAGGPWWRKPEPVRRPWWSVSKGFKRGCCKCKKTGPEPGPCGASDTFAEVTIAGLSATPCGCIVRNPDATFEFEQQVLQGDALNGTWNVPSFGVVTGGWMYRLVIDDLLQSRNCENDSTLTRSAVIEVTLDSLSCKIKKVEINAGGDLMVFFRNLVLDQAEQGEVIDNEPCHTVVPLTPNVDRHVMGNGGTAVIWAKAAPEEI